MKSVITFLLLFFLLAGCQSPAHQPEMREEIKIKHADGSPRKAVYFDKKTDEKRLEREFYPENKPFREWNYQSGMKNGEARSYRQDGRIWSLNTYKNDTLNGIYKTWQENGKLFIEGQYDMGKKTGIWKFYGADGELVRSFDYATMDSLQMRN